MSGFLVSLAGFAFTQMGMSAIEDLQRTMARLRAPDGCPWDQAQTHRTLARCLIDECSELLDTIDRNDLPHMREELGDVLIQIVFHAQLAAERGDFTFEDVAREINDKLIRRHPHVFGDHDKLGTADEVITKWEQIKSQEKKNGPTQSGVFKEMPPRLPALMFAEAVVKQIEKKSLPADGALHVARIARLAGGLSEEDAGRRLFELAAACRLGGIDPEAALRKECDRVMREVEAKVDAGLRTASESN
jgi:XTP/dITP diphosphohydrolase/tetrapyrrole methylase family protein/MazG family protein